MREARDEAEPEEGLAAMTGSDPALVGLGAPRDGWCVLRRGRDPLGRPRRLVVGTVAGREAAGSPLATLLEGLGFTRDGPAWSWRAL